MVTSRRLMNCRYGNEEQQIVKDIQYVISSVHREKIPTRRPADPPTGRA
jgi:predicted fused transcriptional regulator/phosphomethylpyrimidine kinase